MAIISNINDKLTVSDQGEVSFNRIGASTSTGYTFPSTDGANGQILKTNGLGILTFVTDDPGGNVTGSGTLNKVARWTATGDDLGDGPILFSNATAAANSTFGGNVGIGSAPEGNPATRFLAVGTAGSVAGGIQLWATNAQTHYIQFGDAASGGNYYRGAIGYAHASDTLLLLQSGSTALSFTGSQAATFAGDVIGGTSKTLKSWRRLQTDANNDWGLNNNSGSPVIAISAMGTPSTSTTTFAGDVIVGESASPEVRLKKTNAGTGTVRFQNDGSNTSYIQLDASEDMVYYGGASVDQVFYAGGALNETKSGALSTFAGSGTFGDAVRINATTTTGLVIASSSGASNGLKLYNNSTSDNAYIYNHFDGNLEIGTNNATVLTMNGTTSTFAGMVDIIGSRSTYVNNAEDDTATSHIFTTDSLVGDFAQLAGSLVLQARVNDAIYRDIILAGGLGTAANPVAPILTVKGEGVVFIDGSFNVSEGSTFANMITINIDDISTGENRGVRLINTAGVDQQWNITAGVTGEENDSFCIRNSTDNINALKIGRNSTATFAGNVLINKASNPTSLQIGSNLTDDPFIVFQTDGNTMSMGIDRSDSNKFKISENATLGTNDRLCIDGTGNIGIGTSATNSKLMISDTSNRNFSTAQFKIEGAGYTAVHYLDGTEYMIQQNSGSRRIRMMAGTTNGVLLNPGATAWASASDIKLKENIKPLKNVLDKIQDYRCVEYNFKNDKDKKIGFIAQDWKNDFPAIIDEDKDGLLGMKYTETIPVLLKAIQEQQKQIKELQDKSCSCNNCNCNK